MSRKNKTTWALILLIALVSVTVSCRGENASPYQGLAFVPVDICPDIDLVYFISDIDCHVEQVRVLLPILYTRNQWTASNFDADVFAENFNVLIGSWESSAGSRSNRLKTLQLLTIEAKHIVNIANDFHDKYPVIIVRSALPCAINNTYGIIVLGEEYLALTDLILAFLNIQEDQLEITYTPEMPRAWNRES